MSEKEVLKGMRDLCQVLKRSETTVLGWYKHEGLPIWRTKDGGIWMGEKSEVLEWFACRGAETEYKKASPKKKKR